MAASKCDARVIYISTDYVFNGESGPYNEDDIPSPTGYYAKSKLAGENVVRGARDDTTIIRSIVIYGFGRNIKSSFVTWLLGELRAGRKVRIVNDQWGNSTITEDLAEAIDRLISTGKHGLYHMGGKSFMTRFEMAVRTGRYFGLDESLITPITTAELKQPAKRPLRSGLLTHKAETELLCKFRDLEQSLQIYKTSEFTSTEG
jgi:dTDP-4-dehydrorhamnose reductase